MYITGIRLKHIRGFEKLNLDLSGSSPRAARPRMRTVIIGENGTCKTTLLRCIAIGLCDKKDASGLLPEPIGQLVAVDENDATIEIDLLEKGALKPTTIKTILGSDNGQDYLKEQEGRFDSKEELLVCGYGVGRSHEGPETGRAYRIIDSVYTLFRYDEPLVGAELMLRRLRDHLGTKLYSKMMRGIKRVLGLGPKYRIEVPKGGGVTISGPKFGKSIPLEGWADGYRITFYWLLDFYAWAMRAKCITRTGGIRGILLVDEPEQHLHPSMQTALLDRLGKMFPDVQIIATTHSPLVALGTLPSELVVLKRMGKKVLASTDVRDFTGYSAEDMLVDEKLFDSDIYSPETNKKLDDYRKLISIPARKRTEAQKNKLKYLAEELSTQEILEDNESVIDRKLRGLIKKYDI